MNIFDLIIESLTTLAVNKLRTGLAMLGIVIGIGSVIALISLGQSSQQSVESQIQSLGSNLLTVSPGSQQSGGVRGMAGGGTTLTLADAKAIEESTQLTTVGLVSPEYQSQAQIVTSQSNTNTRVIGVTDAYLTAHNVQIAQGSFVTQRDNDAMAKVAVLGPQTAEDLFGENSNPIGQTIRINGQALTVIGVTVSKGGTGFMNQDDIVYVPLVTAQKQLFGDSHLTSIVIQATSEDVMLQTQNEVGYFLLARHKISDPAEADFMISSQQDLLNTVSSVTGTFTTLLAGVAAISLLVGGIGIMNIMLVTVTERTREIGLRKALGAKKKTVITQFLIESIMLTLVGGLIGVGIGLIASYLIAMLISTPFVVAIESVLLAFGVSAVIGIIFGWYPAQRAANLQPIEALRYE